MCELYPKERRENSTPFPPLPHIPHCCLFMCDLRFSSFVVFGGAGWPRWPFLLLLDLPHLSPLPTIGRLHLCAGMLPVLSTSNACDFFFIAVAVLLLACPLPSLTASLTRFGVEAGISPLLPLVCACVCVPSLYFLSLVAVVVGGSSRMQFAHTHLALRTRQFFCEGCSCVLLD